jgi:hypothetical protein
MYIYPCQFAGTLMGISPFQMESCQVLNLCSMYGVSRNQSEFM